MPRAVGGFVELGVELPKLLKGNDAAMNKLLKLPNGFSRDAVPSAFEKFLTPQAWKSICIEMKEQDWEFTTGDQTGSSLADKLALQYKSLKFSFKKDVYSEAVSRVQNGGREVVVFKIVIDADGAEAPAQPMTGEAITAAADKNEAYLAQV
jgi:hypothetical protein